MTVMTSTTFLIACLIPGVMAGQVHRIEFESFDLLPDVRVNGQHVDIHTQGLYVTDCHFLVTGRLETKPKRALLIRFDRHDLKSYELVDITPPMTSGETLDHPGGFDVDGDGNCWIPISTSHRNGPSLVCRFMIDADRPLPREPEYSFRVDDHIGAICCIPNNSLVGANWDTLQVYAWAPTGRLISTRDRSKLFPRSTNWSLAVQDWKFVTSTSDAVVAGGLDKSRNPAVATIQLIDFSASAILESHPFPMREGVTRPITNEGLAVYEGKFYLLPEDIGRGAKVLRYSFSGDGN